MLKHFAIVLACALAPMVAQDQATSEPKDGKKNYEQFMKEWHAEENQRAIAAVVKGRTELEQELRQYKDLLETRKDLTAKLQRALDDGDETLIQVAVSDVKLNTMDLQYRAKQVVGWSGERLMQAARNAYSSYERLITEEVYTGHLKFYREAKKLTEEPAPKELVELIAKAKVKLPDYFAILEQQGYKVL